VWANYRAHFRKNVESTQIRPTEPILPENRRLRARNRRTGTMRRLARRRHPLARGSFGRPGVTVSATPGQLKATRRDLRRDLNAGPMGVSKGGFRRLTVPLRIPGGCEIPTEPWKTPGRVETDPASPTPRAAVSSEAETGQGAFEPWREASVYWKVSGGWFPAPSRAESCPAGYSGSVQVGRFAHAAADSP
jgi:hypothetical protein